MKSILVRHVLPYFKGKKLWQINKLMVEDWLLKLREKKGRTGVPLSATTVNNCFACFRIMMNQGEEWDLIEKSPIKKSMILSTKPRERGVFTIDEIRMLFGDMSLETTLRNNLKYFTTNPLPLTTGMRQGEVLGLQVKHIFDDYISVMPSWAKKYSLDDPKWNSKRQVPIQMNTYKVYRN